MSELDENLFIRCNNETRKRFRHFYVEHGFRNYEETLKELLKIAENNPNLVKIRWG